MALDPALASFCRQAHPRLVGSLTLYTADPALAEEIAQDALASLITTWAEVQHKREPLAWAHTVALNLARTRLRRRRVGRRLLRLAATTTPTVHHDPDAGDAVAVRQALQCLPHRQRAVLIARFYAGHSVAETAHILDVPQGTVKSDTHRALAALRALLGDDALAAPATGSSATSHVLGPAPRPGRPGHQKPSPQNGPQRQPGNTTQPTPRSTHE
ncbi:sigma-70 family RNA polymerase sigma factor [Euzebya tangerina]|uniref:sigma-70 family RNA polymerase sigma factor n=1 Tax=Euzebya tangerina TaxID=591198 RepID=UPI000E313065|nr:sigma-70 family RNA polymerase sigma factor [Euzebya tangerina]